MEKVEIRIRKAAVADVPVLQKLIHASVRALQAGDYTREQMDGALESVFGVDSQLIADGTYLVAEARVVDEGREAGEAASGRVSKNRDADWALAGCGGWSKRKTLYGSDQWTGREDTLLDPRRDAAKIRAFFIHPDWARRGVGSKVLEACEVAAREAGFTSYEMGATLTGAKLFGVKGYVEIEKIQVPLKNGQTLPVIRMAKRA